MIVLALINYTILTTFVNIERKKPCRPGQVVLAEDEKRGNQQFNLDLTDCSSASCNLCGDIETCAVTESVTKHHNARGRHKDNERASTD